MEETDLGGVPHVGPSTQLPAHLRDAHHRTMSAYFSPKNAIAPAATGLFIRQEFPRDGPWGEDNPVHLLLDRGKRFGREGLEVGKVEPELVGPDVRTGLLHVGARIFRSAAWSRCVAVWFPSVRRRDVSSTRRRAPCPPERPRKDLDPVDDLVGGHPAGVLYPEGEAVPPDVAVSPACPPDSP